jgi:hypothetical protein
MEIIEELSANETLNDGTYLDLTNNLKKLYEFSDQLKKNAIYVVYDRHVRIARERPEVPKNYELKIKHGYIPCEFCGRLITNTKSAIKEHQSREICHRIRIEKRGAIFTKNGKRSDFEGIETAYHILHDWSRKHIEYQRELIGNPSSQSLSENHPNRLRAIYIFQGYMEWRMNGN